MSRWWPGPLLSISLAPASSCLLAGLHIVVSRSFSVRRRRRRKEKRGRGEAVGLRKPTSDQRSLVLSAATTSPGLLLPGGRCIVLLFCESFLRQSHVGVLWRILHRWLVKSSPPGRGPERCQWLAQPDLCYDQQPFSSSSSSTSSSLQPTLVSLFSSLLRSSGPIVPISSYCRTDFLFSQPLFRFSRFIANSICTQPGANAIRPLDVYSQIF